MFWLNKSSTPSSFVLSDGEKHSKKTIYLSDKIIVLMRGLPSSGKSTFLREHGCEDYSISPDAFHIVLSPPVTLSNGERVINHNMNDEA